MAIHEVKLGIEEGEIDARDAAELLNVTKNNLRQLVYRKVLTPIGKYKRRSVFNAQDVLMVKEARKPWVPSA